MGLFSGISNLLFGKDTTEADIQAATQAGRTDIQTGMGRAEEALSPYLTGSQKAYDLFQQQLFGTPTATESLPGFGSMKKARGEALEDLATGKAGMGMLFSGRTAEEAADIGGSMEQQLRDRFMNMLMGETQAGRGLSSQLSNMLFGGGQAMAGQGMQGAGMGADAQFRSREADKNLFGDILGGIGTMLGG
jgi:hypothetical protein